MSEADDYSRLFKVSIFYHRLNIFVGIRFKIKYNLGSIRDEREEKGLTPG